ncbi:transcriptional regulator [Micromonospora echinospora]|uniref:Helix-turn-helix domain-containing protein n=1 Tax=Micromonospora echinospora TaxID=1877 RepID=A0A1C4V671_MICEC|nr:helix-turn-helix transcriptional regulator [Micromonospora echinospora]OZV83105.1 transcriptional regulator [Micromonospora echinospora]SCE79311.1 Helix-turn-helix domain-containing protein [Micromonospora echinospora]
MSQTVTGSTLLRRQIGRKFESLRKSAGLTMEQAAERLDRARATLHRIESGAESVRFRKADVEQMLRLYDAPPEECEILLAMAAATRENKNWWHDYIGSGLPRWFQLYVGLEASASSIRQYEAELVPGLLQTRAYAEQVFRTPGGSVDHEERTEHRLALDARAERQRLLTRFAPPQLDVMISEAVLRRAAGSGQIMSEQIRQMIKAAELPNVTIRVVPFSAGLHAGAMSGSFSILDFPRDATGDPLEPTVTYHETATGAVYLDKPHETTVYNAIWTELAGCALDEAASRTVLEQIEKEYTHA